MINNRLFKKINAVFWGILTWLPIVILVLCLFKTSDISFGIVGDSDAFTPYKLIEGYISGFVSAVSSNIDGWFYNPLSNILYGVLGVFEISIYEGIMTEAIIEVCSWVCWVQVMRLLVYVFYWFIDLISGLFDLMTFNRKGDN